MTRKKGRLVLLLVILACLGGVSYKVTETIISRKAQELKKNPLSLLDALPEAALQLKEFRRTKVDDGRKVWEIAGEEARYLKEQNEVILKKPTFAYYDINGDSIHVSAAEGHVYLVEQEMDRMELEGEVQMSYRGFVLETGKVLYSKNRNQVMMPGRVKVTGEGLEFEGVGMEITLDQEKLRLLQNVRSRMEPERLKNSRIAQDVKKKP
jgi:LPS export ABC transporter protein LptC